MKDDEFKLFLMHQEKQLNDREAIEIETRLTQIRKLKKRREIFQILLI